MTPSGRRCGRASSSSGASDLAPGPCFAARGRQAVRHVLPWMLLGLAGCSGGGGVTGAEQRAVRESVEREANKPCVDTLAFSRWEGETVEAGGESYRVVRAKFACDDGTRKVTLDRLYKLRGGEVLGSLDNRAGDDWKKGVRGLQFPK